jgi:hypothetical protein
MRGAFELSGSNSEDIAAREKLVAEILDLRFPSWAVMRDFWTGLQIEGSPPGSELVDACRDSLSRLRHSDLVSHRQELLARRQEESTRHKAEREAKAAQKAATKEAARFYNTQQAQADFDHWARMEYWAFEEAIASCWGGIPDAIR